MIKFLAAVTGLSCLISSALALGDSLNPDYISFDGAEPLPTFANDWLASSQNNTVVSGRGDIHEAFYGSDGTGVWRVTSDTDTPSLVSRLPSNDTFKVLVHSDRLLALSTTSNTEARLYQKSMDQLDKDWRPIDLPSPITPPFTMIGLNNLVFIFAENRSYAFEPRLGSWSEVAGLPGSITRPVGAGLGDGHILLADTSGARDSSWLYHSVTDRWLEGPRLPLEEAVEAILSDGTGFQVIGDASLYPATAVLRANQFEVLDYIAVACLILPLAGIGIYYSRKQKSSGDYFRAGKSIPWWAASLSIFATNASAITIMSMPAMAYVGDWIYVSIALFLISIQVPLFLLVYVPLLRRLNVSTANEYLERRYGLSIRILGFLGFSLNQILGRMAAILLLPAIAMNAIFGLPLSYCILIVGMGTTLFAAGGGLSAVIWTDVFQALLVLVAVLVSMAFAISAIEFSPAEAWSLLNDKDKLRIFDLRWDWQSPVVIVLFLNSLATSLGYIGDQNFVQRVQCTPKESDAKKASVMQLVIAVPLNFVLFSLGTLLFLYYVTRPGEISPAMKMDGIYPFFAASALPSGMAGVVVVALMAATISTISSALNSVSNLGVEDIYRRFVPSVSDHQCVRLGRVLTLSLGVFGTAVALLLANSDGLQSVWNLFLMVTGLVVGPVTGIFVLGIFSRRVNTAGVWCGAIASVFSNFVAKTFLDLHATVFLTVGVATCIIVGYVASLLFPSDESRLDGLTIYTLGGSST